MAWSYSPVRVPRVRGMPGPSGAGGGGGPPSGPAGGSLTGTYPDPGLAPSGVGAGTYGTAVTVPRVTVSGEGRVTAVSEVAITAGGAAVHVGPDAPATPAPGQLWWRNDPDGSLYIYYDDGTSLQFVPATPTIAGPPGPAGPPGAAGPPSGGAGGDLGGSYPNPTVVKASGTFSVGANDAITWGTGVVKGHVISGGISHRAEVTVNIRDTGVQDDVTKPAWRIRLGADTDNIQFNRQAPGPGAVTNRLTLHADGRLTVAADPTAALDLATKQYVDANVGGGGAPSGPAGGDLTGTYPDPTIAAGAVGNAEISDVAWSKVSGAPASFPPSGAAGGDLTGTYPNPTVGALKITDANVNDVAAPKLTGTIAQARFPVAPSGLLTANLNDAQITDAKIASVAYAKVTGAPSTLPPSGAASGDLTGTYPGPTVAKVNGAAVGTTTPLARGDILVADATPALARVGLGSSGQVLQSNGTDAVWATPPGGPPSGAAGGDLNGTYPSPGVFKASGAFSVTGLTTLLPNDSLIFGGGTGTVKGHLCASSSTQRAELTVNVRDAGAQDDVSLPSWRIRLGAGTDDIQFNRNPAGGALVTLAKLSNTGRLTIGADPTGALDVVTKQYVDARTVGASESESVVGQATTFTTTEVTIYTKAITTTKGTGGLLLIATPCISLAASATYTVTLRLKLDGATLTTLTPGAMQCTTNTIQMLAPTINWFVPPPVTAAAHTITVTAQRDAATGTATYRAMSFTAVEVA